MSFTDFKGVKADAETRMAKAFDALKKDFSGLRTGRATTSMLDSIVVDAYGSKSPLNQVASVSVPDPRTLSIQVWDRGVAKSVEKAIREANLGLNPVSDGQLIRVPIPPLSEERRIEITKIAAKYTEQAKVAVRNIRRESLDAVKKLEKDGYISEDERKRNEDEIQKLTDANSKKLDEALKIKEQEIKQV